jgi:hypothetical protein
VVGVELSDIQETTCAPLWRRGLVKQGPLHAIPFPSRAFDLVFSTEVLEHVPPELAQKSVDELVRCAKQHVLATISLRPSALDVPGKPPKVRIRVRLKANHRKSGRWREMPGGEQSLRDHSEQEFNSIWKTLFPAGGLNQCVR